LWGIGLLKLFRQKNEVENKVFIDETADIPAEKDLWRYLRHGYTLSREIPPSHESSNNHIYFFDKQVST